MQLYNQNGVNSQYYKSTSTFKALNSIYIQKCFRKNFNDTTKVNVTLKNNHLL